MSAIDDVRPGDVILVSDDTWLARLICFFDNTGPACHAAIAVGDYRMAEVGWRGLEYSDLTELANREQIWLRRLPSDLDMTRVVAKALEYTNEGRPYAYHQLLLVALLALVRWVPTGDWIERKMVDAVLCQAARLVTALVGGKRDPMICSEFVYRCYNDADPSQSDLYTLKVGVVDVFDLMKGASTDRVAPGSLAADLRDNPPPERLEAVPPLRDETSADEILAQAEAELSPLVDALVAAKTGATASERMPAMADETISDEQLREHAAAFAEAFAAAGGIEVKGHTFRGVDLETLWKQIIYKAADFVTPNDLLTRARPLEDGGHFLGSEV